MEGNMFLEYVWRALFKSQKIPKEDLWTVDAKILVQGLIHVRNPDKRKGGHEARKSLRNMRMPTCDPQCNHTFFRYDLGRSDDWHLLDLGLILFALMLATILLLASQWHGICI